MVADQQGDAHESPTGADDTKVQVTRAWMGLLVVMIGDVAIAIAAVVGLSLVPDASRDTATSVSILSSAFTAIATMTTAYFGIRAASNTAQSSMTTKPSPETAPAQAGGA
jgi:arginine exporter protein ArgO